MAQASPMPTCPMAETCRGMMERMEKPLSGVMMMTPGIGFIALGLLVLVWPAIVPWLAATAFILAGLAMLAMANFMRGMGARFRRT